MCAHSACAPTLLGGQVRQSYAFVRPRWSEARKGVCPKPEQKFLGVHVHLGCTRLVCGLFWWQQVCFGARLCQRRNWTCVYVYVFLPRGRSHIGVIWRCNIGCVTWSDTWASIRLFTIGVCGGPNAWRSNWINLKKKIFFYFCGKILQQQVNVMTIQSAFLAQW